MEFIKRLSQRFHIEVFLIVTSMLLTTLITWQTYRFGLMRILVDQNAHLNLARQTIDSMTPGLSQIGFWPPLLHIVLIPAVAFDTLYRSGLAAVITLLPFLTLGAVFLYKTLQLLTKNRMLSVWGALLFLLNPYVLYYTATPMMEILFLTNLFGTAYFMTRWTKSDQLRDLLLTGFFITLTTLSRFEGIILLPIAVALVLARFIQRRTHWRRIEAFMIVFFFLASLGVVAILAYGYVLVGNPLAFMNSQWSAAAQQRDYMLPTQHSVTATLQYLLHASYHLFSLPLTWIAIIGFPILLFLRPRFEVITASLVLISPFLFDALALFRGNAVLYVPELAPFSGFFNERYGLYWIGFAIMVPTLLLALFWSYAKLRAHSPLVPSVLVGVVAVGSLLVAIGGLYKVAFRDKFQPIQLSLRYSILDQRDIARALGRRYDFGSILMTRALHDIVAIEAGIALKHYIHESNDKYYDLVLERPWLFARWVVMQNPSAPQPLAWVVQNEKVSLNWAKSQEFAQYYTLVLENETERLYKVNEEAVRASAAQQGYSIYALPSLNSAVTSWEASTIYKDMSTPLIVNAKLPQFYASQLRPNYEKGFFMDDTGSGNSESQSYAMLQSFEMGDRETFARVWQWTKTHLQRKNDRLFAWKFAYDPAADAVHMNDANSASDADTDIAYALLKAGTAWNEPAYIEEGRAIVRDIWAHEVTNVGERLVMTAGNWAAATDEVAVNPSYFAPYSYRLFATHDPKHDWPRLVSDSYVLLGTIEDYRAAHAERALPPNWVALNKGTGRVSPFMEKSESLDYSYDAFRTFWRVAEDALQNPKENDAAFAYLSRTRTFQSQWQEEQRVCTIDLADRMKNPCDATTSTLAGPLAIFSATSPFDAEGMVKKYYLGERDLIVGNAAPFYEKSWYWFALRLWSRYTKKREIVLEAKLPQAQYEPGVKSRLSSTNLRRFLFE